MGKIETIYDYPRIFGHFAVVGDKHFLHPGSKFKLLLKSYLPEAFFEEPYILNCNNNDARQGLYEVKMFENGTHSLSFFFDIADKDECKMNVVVENRNYDI